MLTKQRRYTFVIFIMLFVHFLNFACPAKVRNTGSDAIKVVHWAEKGWKGFDLKPHKERLFGSPHFKTNMVIFWKDGVAIHVHQIACTADKGEVTFHTEDIRNGSFESGPFGEFFKISLVTENKLEGHDEEDEEEGSPEDQGISQEEESEDMND